MPPAIPTRNQPSSGNILKNALSGCEDIFIEIARLHTSRTSYTLTQEANDTVNCLNKEFIAEVSEAITEGQTPPMTKNQLQPCSFSTSRPNTTHAAHR